MKTVSLRDEMHRAIEVIEDEDFLQAVYLILNEKSKDYEFELSTSEKKELDRLRKEHKAGKSVSYTMDQVRKHARAKLKR